MKLTPWYRADQKPVRVGWYEVKSPTNPDITFTLQWNGQEWGHYDCFFWYDALLQNREWRGLTAPHNK